VACPAAVQPAATSACSSVSAQRRQQAQQADELALAAGFGLAQDVAKLRPRSVFGDLAIGAVLGQRAARKQRQRQPRLGRR
jgi:hypothetical protein